MIYLNGLTYVLKMSYTKIDEIDMTSPDPVDIKVIVIKVNNRYTPSFPRRVCTTNGVMYPAKMFYLKLVF